ncbi:hypothetical protein FraEuI1c_0220 [Pseudofrankia inefficax]|uniref:Uncharacterized protein n=1 Tax=Pseudofrankia inefficax (strain DSM 45817 / CECT 9037 / DDB 130130 / EuI1c) TaxID=298654 RepID=E3J617_PSEI1|nr:hypothetical protein FraEuI1c_0220 [Pseudofrankia inefficax]
MLPAGPLAAGRREPDRHGIAGESIPLTRNHCRRTRPSNR